MNEEVYQSNIDAILRLFSDEKYTEAIEALSNLDNKYPNKSLISNIRGACYAGLGQFDDAIKFYKKAIKIEPNYSKAHFNLAGAYHEIGKLEHSISSYQCSLEIDPKYPEVHNNLANVYRETGDFDQAIEHYKKAIEIKPEYIEACYSLAITLQHVGNLESIKYFEKVISLKPDFAEAHNNLGVVFKEIDQIDDAVKSYKSALTINPNYAEAQNNLGNAFKDLGDLFAAVESFKKAIFLKPDFPVFHNNLGNVLKNIGKLDESLESYHNSLKINPDFSDTHNNIGIALYEQGKFEESIKSYKRAISIEPNYAEAHNNLGTVYKDQNHFEKAILSYEKAIEINPDYVDAFNNLGVIFKSSGRLNDAIDYYNQALSINPENPDTLNNLGNVQSELDLLDEAVKTFKKAVKIKPDFADAFNNLSIAYFKLDLLDEAIQSIEKCLAYKPDDPQAFVTKGRIFSKQNQLELALKNFETAYSFDSELKFALGNILQTKMRLCHWDDLPNLLNNLRAKIENDKEVILPFDLLSLIDDPELQFRSSKIYANFEYPLSKVLSPIDNFAKKNKVKVGYFSADFKDHPVATLTAELYELHDRSQFEVHAFSFGPDTNDEMNLRIKAGVDYFHNVINFSHKDVVNLSRHHEIDIAVDLGGFTAKSRTEIFAMSAAAIQISYIGYLGTMGAEYYDYLIADKIMIPEENQQFFSEKIVYLPSYQVNDSKETPPDIYFSRKDLGLPEDGFVFCCFNNTYKITPHTFDSWARILSEVDKSVLMIYVNNEFSQKNLIKEIIARGINPKRLVFGDNLPRPEYLARYRVADLFLDTAPYNAGTTASDALRMGLPVLTLKGNSFNSREAFGVINALNLPELITHSQEEYESLAIDLANNPDKLNKIKDKLSANLKTAPLYNTELFTKNLETAYLKMYERHHKGLKPDHIILD